MSQTTRCPSCHTRFKVVADQLRISDGWVRCGQCNQVFDATDSLEAAPPPAMFPDMNLEGLRGPVARAQAPAAPQAAWNKAGPPQASEQSRVDDPAEWAPWMSPSPLPLPAARSDHSVKDESLHRDSFPEDSPPDFENTVPAELWSDLDLDKPPGTAAPQRFVAEIPFVVGGRESTKRDLLEADSVAARYQEAVSSLAVAPSASPHAEQLRMEVAESAAPARSALQSEDAKSGKPASVFVDRKHELAGYELPGSDVGDEVDDWPLFSEPPSELSDDAFAQPAQESTHRITEAEAPDAAEPDLAHFIAEFTELQDSRQPEHGAPGDGTHCVDDLSSGRREPTLNIGPLLRANAPVPSEESVLGPDEGPDWRLLDADRDLHASAHMPDSGQEKQGEVDDRLDTELVDSTWGSEPEPLVVHEPSFVRHARRRAFWSRATVRSGLWLAALLLVVLLVGQLAVHHRDLVSARFPQARAALVSLCEPFRCVVEPPRDIGAILVDGSSFNRTQGDRYQFLLTLRNQSKLPVQAPVIELTLTDVQDQPVVRRVLQTDELRLPGVFQPQQEWSGEMPMIMAPGTARIAGYRVLAFYPN